MLPFQLGSNLKIGCILFSVSAEGVAFSRLHLFLFLAVKSKIKVKIFVLSFQGRRQSGQGRGGVGGMNRECRNTRSVSTEWTYVIGETYSQVNSIDLGMNAAYNHLLKYHFSTLALEVKISKHKIGAQPNHIFMGKY